MKQMKNINLFKVVNVLTVLAMISMVAVPLLALATSHTGTGGLGQGFTAPVPPSSAGVASDTDLPGLLMRVIMILLGVAGLVAVIFLIVGGFRYITAGGNEEAAEAGKKTITNAIIGIVIIILSFVIVRVVANAVKSA